MCREHKQKSNHFKIQINYSLALPVSHKHIHCDFICFFLFVSVAFSRPIFGIEEQVMLRESHTIIFLFAFRSYERDPNDFRPSMILHSVRCFMFLSISQPWEWNKLKNERHGIVASFYQILFLQCIVYSNWNAYRIDNANIEHRMDLISFLIYFVLNCNSMAILLWSKWIWIVI